MTSCQAFHCTNEKGKCEKMFSEEFMPIILLSKHRPVITKTRENMIYLPLPPQKIKINSYVL